MSKRLALLLLILVPLSVFLFISVIPEPFKDFDAKHGPPQESQNPSYTLPDLPSTQNISQNTGQCGNEIGNGNQTISGPAGPEGGDRDNPFRALTIHPTNPDSILLGTERNGFVRSDDGGKTWKRLRYGLRHGPGGYTEVYDVGLSLSNPRVIYAVTTGGGYGPVTGDYPSSSGGVYKSVDGGESWSRKNCGIEKNGGRTTAIHIDTENENRAIIAISGGKTSYFDRDIKQGQFIPGGIYLTEDGGDSWTRVRLRENDDNNEYSYIRYVRSNPSILYLFGYNFEDPNLNIGFYKSTDKGKTWLPFAAQLRSLQISSFDVSSDGSTIYAVSQNKERMEILKSTDGGNSWSRHPLNSTGYTVSVSPDDANKVLFGKPDGIYLSTDGMKNQTKVVDNLKGHLSDVVFSQSHPGTVYAITLGYILYKSSDGGRTFQKVKDIRNEVLNKGR